MTASPALPAGYVTERLGAVTLVARVESLAAARSMIERAGSLHAFAASHGAALAAHGRGVVHHAPVGDDAWIIRRYRRGGRVARVLGDRYLHTRTPRPFRELSASAAARLRGVRTPAIEAATITRAGLFYRADLATRFVPDAQDLATLLRNGEVADAPALWRAAGSLLRDTFAAGVIHADLNLGNVLVQHTGAAPLAHLLDLDRARVTDRVSRRSRERMIARFHRSRRKLERQSGHATKTASLHAFDEALGGLRDAAGA